MLASAPAAVPDPVAMLCVEKVWLSIGCPSTTNNGWFVPESEAAPRILIDADAPGSPDCVRTSTFGAWAAIRPANDSGSDLPIYEEDASIILHGNVPYRDLPIEYPPGALPMFLLPAVMFGDARDAHWSPPNDAGRRYHLAFD